MCDLVTSFMADCASYIQQKEMYKDTFVFYLITFTANIYFKFTWCLLTFDNNASKKYIKKNTKLRGKGIPGTTVPKFDFLQ